MDIKRAINISKGCVMSSFLDSETKQAVLEVLSQVDISKNENIRRKNKNVKRD